MPPAPSSPVVALTTPIERVPGVGPSRAGALRALGITNAGRLVAHLPMRHEFEEAEAPIAALSADRVVSARGEIGETRVHLRRPRPRFEATLRDETGVLYLIWFHQPMLGERIRPGMTLRVQGKAQRFGPGLRLTNPRWETINEQAEPGARAARLRPVYPASEAITSRIIDRIIARSLDALLAQIEDHLPEEFLRERGMPGLRDAYRMMHRPASEDEVAGARRRLAYDELLLMQLGVHMKRAYVRRTLHAPALRWDEPVDRHIRDRLPFALTPGQEDAVREIAGDLQKSAPANRLIQGDVGSGKTAVALYAMLMAVASKHQAALLAPTEILAEQHARVIEGLLRGSKVRTALLTGNARSSERAALLDDLARGAIDIAVGTHALLGKGVRFASLALAVIDEQHRFGVHQRALLRQKGDGAVQPHVLVMTATPIPRTLALTVFGDLDVSVIRGAPPGRRPVVTRRVTPDQQDEVLAYLRGRIEKGEQCYVVLPAIGGDTVAAAPGVPHGADDDPEPADSSGQGPDREPALRDVRSTAAKLERGAFAGLRLAVMHGRLKRDEREAVMERFRAGAVQVLVSTTVIEVGVDVPNATLMLIENADRFGLAQLHQLRGRVARGTRRGLCVLSAASVTPESEARLGALVRTADGFALAEIDLELRGPGEVLGARQAGDAPFRVAQFPRDTDLLLLARRDAGAWIDRSPTLARTDEAVLRRRLLKAHGASLGLADIA